MMGMLLGFLATPVCPAAQDGTVTIDAGTPGTAIPPTLFGAFFEEINHGGDGGLYGEMLRNRSFAEGTDFWVMQLPSASGWQPSSGTWSLNTAASPPAYMQSANGQDFRSTYQAPGSGSWADYTLSLQARKLGGAEGFLVMFNVADSKNYFWWNLGGWSNGAHGIERCVNGTKSTLAYSGGNSIATGQWYDIRIEIQGTSIHCYLDNVLMHSITTDVAYSGTIGLSTWNTQAEYRNISVTGPGTQLLYQSDFSAAGASATMSVDTSRPLNASNTGALKLTRGIGTGSLELTNSGYYGIPLQAGANYDLSFHTSCSEDFTGPIEVRLESADGSKIYAQTSFTGLTTQWQKFSATLIPDTTDARARLRISMDQPGSVWLDVVSLFPQATYKNRDNGLRPDLATAVADMNPGFFRFPGGCFVEGSLVSNAFRWKESIGDISERPGHWGIWGYGSTDGLGYHEYLQYSEDIGAEPIFCINAGMSHGDVVPLDQMGEYVQDALDAIEYANGDVNTTWGAKRAAAGHPEPFNMKYIEIGNENGGPDYNERYTLFYDAIKAAYPEMKIIAAVWGGTPWSRPFDLMDEHYYTDAATMLSWATRYDSYSRSGPKVFVGEYAVNQNHGTYGNLTAAIAEAAFMTGIERNCDVVEMAAYAPLFCRVGMNIWQWTPDAIYFDNTRWFGTPAYHVQKMFANNMGTALLPTTQDFRAGSIGLSTWNTQAEFRNITVTDSNAQLLYQSGFESGASDWVANSGTWGVNTTPDPDSYRQTANGQDDRATYTGEGSANWKDYTLTLQARKNGGSEGFLIMFHVADSNNWVWWNLGGWNNTAHAIQYCVNGSKITGPQVSGSINTNQWYNIRISVQGNTVNCYLDDVLTQSFTFPSSAAPIHSVASMNGNTREIIIKSVNPSGSAITANMVLNGVAAIGANSSISTLSSANPADENTLDSPDRVVPVEGMVSTPSPQFTLELPAYSVNILRVQTPALAPQNLTVTPGNQQALVKWNAAPGATAYTVKRATASGGPYTVVGTGLTDTRFTDSSLANGTTYFYIVTADNSAGTTSTASEASATPLTPPIEESELSAPSMVTNGSDATITVKDSVPGRSYKLQYSNDLQPDHWQDLGDPKTGTGGDVIFTDTHGDLPRRFYRFILR